MTDADPRRLPTFYVRIWADEIADANVIAEALLDIPAATDEELARLAVVTAEGGEPPGAHVVVAPSLPPENVTAPIFLVRRDASGDVPVDDAAPRSFVIGPKLEEIALLRAALLAEALAGLGVTVERVRRAKRPYAIAIIAGAAFVAGAEGVLPAAAAFVVGTQVSAISSLHYLYTGKWMGRAHAMAMLPVFASEAAGGSVFLLVKSFLPPTGVADVAAAIVAASMTVALLGAVAGLLEQGYTLDEREKLRQAFARMQARTKAERGRLVRERHRWKDKDFLRDLVRRVVFE